MDCEGIEGLVTVLITIRKSLSPPEDEAYLPGSLRIPSRYSCCTEARSQGNDKKGHSGQEGSARAMDLEEVGVPRVVPALELGKWFSLMQWAAGVRAWVSRHGSAVHHS